MVDEVLRADGVLRPAPHYRNKYDKSTDGGGMTDLIPIAPQCSSSAPITLLVQHNHMTCGSGSGHGTLLDTAGNVTFKVRSVHLSTSFRRIVQDAQRNDVGQMKRMHMMTPGTHDIWYLGPMDDIKKCSLRCTTDLRKAQHRHTFSANVCLGEVVIGEAHGKWARREFEIRLGGKLAVTVTREEEVLATFLKLDADYQYGIKVEPEVDQAFAVLIVMGLDEISEEIPMGGEDSPGRNTL